MHRLLIAVASLVAELRASIVAAHRLSNCGTQIYLLRGTWNPPGPGIEPVPPALASGFLRHQGSFSVLVFSLLKSFIYFFSFVIYAFGVYSFFLSDCNGHIL